MRCKSHCTDLSSNVGVGVCASCLRERLFHLAVEKNRNSETHHAFPRSISPISQQKTGNQNHHHNLPNQRFFSTPEVSSNPNRKKKHSFIPFSLLSNLFRSNKRNSNSNPRSLVHVSNYQKSYGGDDNVSNVIKSATSSPFWFSNIRSGTGCRNKQPVSFNEASTTSGTGVMRNRNRNRKQYCPDRGMSPVGYSDSEEDAEDEFRNRSGGYETCESRKQTPRRTPAHPSVRRSGGGGNVTGLSFCLSPLVRVSPCRRHWNNQKGVVPVDSGEIRGPVKAHMCANRSRKVADFGRVDKNR